MVNVPFLPKNIVLYIKREPQELGVGFVSVFLALVIFSLFQSPPLYILELTSGLQLTDKMEIIRLITWVSVAAIWLYQMHKVTEGHGGQIFRVLAYNLFPLSVFYGLFSVVLGSIWGWIIGFMIGYCGANVWFVYFGAVVVMLLMYNFLFYYLYKGVCLYCKPEQNQ